MANLIKNFKKRFTIVTSIYLIFMSVFIISDANNGLNYGLTLKVAGIGGHLGKYADKQIGNGNHFISGMEGDLHWKPQTFIESLLLIATNSKTFDFLDIIALTAVFVAILYMFKGSDDSVLFTKNLSKGFKLLIMVIALSGMCADMARMEISRNYIPYITQGQFTTFSTFKFPSFSYLIYPMLLFLTLIPQKGLELQQQQELTI